MNLIDEYRAVPPKIMISPEKLEEIIENFLPEQMVRVAKQIE